MRILIVEDDLRSSRSLELTLAMADLDVYVTSFAGEGVDSAKFSECDLILLDINLPDNSGLETLRLLQSANIETPILVLSGRGSVESKVKSFGAGAADYLKKPVNQQELVARIHAIVRRSKGHAESRIATGGIVVNLRTRRVEIEGETLRLSRKEYQILELLSLRKGTIVTKEAVFSHLYAGAGAPELAIVCVLICKLRKKLSKATGGKNFIQTVHGRGYMLCDPQTRDQSSSQLKTAGRITRKARAEVYGVRVA